MSVPDTEITPLDEDVLVVPGSWRRYVHPRRGGTPGPQAKLDHKALDSTDDLITRVRAAWLDAALTNPANDPQIVAQLRRTLAGEATPAGAAALALATGQNDDHAQFADAWVLRHGITFAVEAALKLGCTQVWRTSRPQISVTPCRTDRRLTPLLRRLRTLLTAAAEEDYATAGAALTASRGCCQTCRMTAAYLVPTRTDWVTELCAEIGPGSPAHPGTHLDYSLLLCALSTPEQVRLLGENGVIMSYTPELDIYVTVVDGLGPAAIALFRGILDGPGLTETLRAANSVLRHIPHDEAFHLFLDRLDRPFFPAAAQEAAALYPRRALRLLADAVLRDDAKAPIARVLLQRHVRTHRELAASMLPTLDEQSSALISELLSTDGGRPEAAVESLPALLVSPPWAREADRKPAGKAPVLPEWINPAALPQVLLRGGGQALPASAVRNLLSAFALGKPEAPFPGVSAVLEALDPGSLAEFGWALFCDWRGMGHPAKEAWTLTALGLVGDDQTVARLVPIIKAWPGESGHRRAVAGLDVLAAIGTDVALQRLDEIAQRVQFTALKARARQKVAEIAAKLGLTGEQLADRLIPDLDLDSDGGLWLDYGPQRFRVGFDEQLKPFVADDAGARRKDLPAPGVKDDADLAAAARKQFGALKKQARAVGADQVRRLESALASQRPWTAAEFNDLLLGHPLMRHVVRRLVWVGEHAGAIGGFRVAEDLTLADSEDNRYTLHPEASVRLAHPLTLPEGVGAWSAIFADYEILQPFPQLGREVHELTEAEKATYRLDRFEGRTVPIGRLLGLTKHGWLRSPAMDNGVENCITKRLAEDRYLVLDLDHGIPVGLVGEDWAAEQTLAAVYLSTQAEVYHSGHKDGGVHFAELDPITASELLGELTRLVQDY